MFSNPHKCAVKMDVRHFKQDNLEPDPLFMIHKVKKNAGSPVKGFLNSQIVFGAPYV